MSEDTICLLDPPTQYTVGIPDPCVSRSYFIKTLKCKSFMQVCLYLQGDGPSTSRAFDEETMSADTEMPEVRLRQEQEAPQQGMK